jgi:hypothetical protein
VAYAVARNRLALSRLATCKWGWLIKERRALKARSHKKIAHLQVSGLFFLKPLMKRCSVEVFQTGHHGSQPNSKNRREVTNARTQSSIQCNGAAGAAGPSAQGQSTSCDHYRRASARLPVWLLWLCALRLRPLRVLRARVFLQRYFPWSWSLVKLGLSSRVGQPSIQWRSWRPL